MKSRVEGLEGILKEKEERIGQLCRRRKANNDVIRRRGSSLEVIGEELSEQEKTLLSLCVTDYEACSVEVSMQVVGWLVSSHSMSMCLFTASLPIKKKCVKS